MNLSVQELEFLAKLAIDEGASQFADRVLNSKHQQAKAYAKRTGRHVRGVCPTMVTNPNVLDKDWEPPEINAMALADRLRDMAKELKERGPYR